jgi:hypothetical protein
LKYRGTMNSDAMDPKMIATIKIASISGSPLQVSAGAFRRLIR